VPELAALGPIFKSSAPVQLTEEGTEYSVAAVKHVTADALVLQFDCSNTVEEQIVENVTVAVDLADAVRHFCFSLLPVGSGCHQQLLSQALHLHRCGGCLFTFRFVA